MKILQRLFLFLAFLAPLGQLRAAVGADNPTGVFGMFNGNVTTGCSYDPYTGNVMRSIPDISVAGAVGSYGLALSRTYNSRNGIGFSYGPSGWRHSYEWAMDDSPITHTQNAQPSSYSVNFPDGRQEIFTYSGSDIYFRAGAGIRERFQPLNLSNMLAYLILPDGGKVKFQATQQSQYDGELHQWSYWYTYVAQAIIDPYGQTTTFIYDGYGRLFQVTEPAGRYIKFFYTTTTGPIVDHVSDNDARTVQYYYSTIAPGGTNYTALTSIVYFGNPTAWTATYQYCAPNTSPSNGVPLLYTCDDPMYPGPMRRIAYTYKYGTNGDGSPAAYGQIAYERYFDGTNIVPFVSGLTIGTANTRTETRGDSRTRTFTYTSAKLTSATDFNAKSASQAYDANGYISSVTDPNGHTTNFTCNALTGALAQIQYPLTTGDTPGQTQRPTVNYTYGSASCADPNNRDANNPYYVCTATDEGGHVTQFTRDTSKRVTRIDYPDGGYETFTYNSFGEVTNHRMTTGGTETFTYGATGLKLTYCDPYHSNGNPPSAWYQYDTYDRLSGVTDVLGSGSGDTAHTTSYAYSARGQMTTMTSPVDPIDGLRHTMVFNTYNPDGTLANTQDALGHVTSYTYDDYRRPLTVTTPGHNTPVTAHSYYDASGTGMIILIRTQT
jgi:YD repeat-containing protein